MKDAGQLKGAIFDWDGTLASIDEREFLCINHAISELGLKPISKEFYIDNCYRRAYELGTGPRIVLEAALAGQDSHVVERAYESYRKIFQSSVDRAVLQRGTLEILRALKGQRFKVGIATMRYTRWVVESELSHLSVAPLVDRLMTRQDLGVKGTMWSLEEVVDQRARLVTTELAEFGLGKSDVLLVGDSWWDIRAGKQLGVKTVLVKTGFAAYNDFSKESPDMVVSSLLELHDSLQNKNWRI